ncbi:hypothetical protein INS49_014985 [Diaporthe citri]|uniref:uncharacterized protein n=1 Tax=Diaporthe citri TaxID=83186 RepID=UPI001C80B735|nr:uncharacterized protein INS49_014985 [Diaporthe citri]KAG6357108.1 hypothetical protein INS49_014985 [Diaporthe citri]
MVARGGPGRSVGGYLSRTPERDVRRRESTPLSDSDQYCEVDSDLEITGSQETVRPRQPQVPPQAIPYKGYPSRGGRSSSSASGSGRGQSQPLRGSQRSTAQVEMQKLAASGARLRHQTAVHNMTMHILRTEQQEIFQNATLEELQNGPQYGQVRARVMRGIAEGTIDQATLARFGGDPPAGGGGTLGKGNNRRGGGAGGGAGGLAGV